ncbi:pyruvate formate-lyase [Photobacterium gaetbulicola]|uniref:Pyruvate formate-lyase n=1 Tax=Photobacterium gaetbulicola TaxID=1295392 RepID=A0A0B9GHX9_9GAMM|nr:glycyl radical protein [Photobacterium gaetbulicola]KHT64390.1 pyruvate formate-lyase [Photobacterium gaetbulicola]
MKPVSQGFSEPTSRVESLRNQILDAVPCIETARALSITASYKETEGQPAIIRRAKAFERILAELPIVIRDNELIVGSATIEPRSSQIFPEFSNTWIEDEFERVGKRSGDSFQISELAKKELREVFPYWQGKTTSELATSYMSSDTQACMDAGVFTVGNYYMNGVGHISVDYAKVLKVGYKGIITEVAEKMMSADKTSPEYIKQEQFYKGIIISCNAAIQFAKRYADKASVLAATAVGERKAELEKIAATCRAVPENGASNFHEACQAFWFVHLMIGLESNGHSISPTRFDQYMQPYFEMDKAISADCAQELIDCIWVKLNDINKVRDEVSTNAFGGYPMFQNLIVGGQDSNGEDATNTLSYMCMEATAHVCLPQPSFSVRVWSKTPDQFLLKACELSRLGLGVPAFYNDEVIVTALVNRGLSLQDARDYGIIGCVEPQCPGKTEGWHDSAFFNLGKLLEITLNGGKVDGKQLGPVTPSLSEFRSFEELISAYQKQTEYFVFHLITADNCVDISHAERAPLPFLSCMVDDCIGDGKSLQEGGAVYNFSGPQGVGAANVGDSFAAIKKLVFDEAKLTLQQVKEALDSNFAGDNESAAQSANDPAYDMVMDAVKKVLAETGSAALLDSQVLKNNVNVLTSKTGSVRQMLLDAPKFGNDIDEVDLLTREGAAIYCREVEKYKNPRGGSFQAGLYPASINVLMGTVVGATPDGRMAGEPLADGVSPSRGMDRSGPTAATNSVAKLDHFIASNGTLYNQKFHPTALQGENGLSNMGALIRSYFDHKGMHVQFNVVNRDTLLAAQNDPEKYRDLVIRIAGYSAQFISLDKSIQDDIIERTEHMF